MRRALISAVVLAALLGGCATVSRKARTVCPEYRSLRCMSNIECSMDAARGCLVCQCGPAAGDQNTGLPPTGVPPDMR